MGPAREPKRSRFQWARFPRLWAGKSPSSSSSSSPASASSPAKVALGTPRHARTIDRWDPTTASEAVFQKIPRHLLGVIARTADGDDAFEHFRGLLLAQRLVESNSPSSGEIAQMIREGHGKLLKSLPIEHRTQALCETAVRSCPWALPHVPAHIKLTLQVCDAAFQELFCDLRALDIEERTFDRCLLAFESGRGIDELPEAERMGEALAAWIQFDVEMSLEFAVHRQLNVQCPEQVTAYMVRTLPPGSVTLWLHEVPHFSSTRVHAIAIWRTQNQGQGDQYRISNVPVAYQPSVRAALAAIEAGYTESNWQEHHAAMNDLIRRR